MSDHGRLLSGSRSGTAASLAIMPSITHMRLNRPSRVRPTPRCRRRRSCRSRRSSLGRIILIPDTQIRSAKVIKPNSVIILVVPSGRTDRVGGNAGVPPPLVDGDGITPSCLVFERDDLVRLVLFVGGGRGGGTSRFSVIPRGRVSELRTRRREITQRLERGRCDFGDGHVIGLGRRLRTVSTQGRSG